MSRLFTASAAVKANRRQDCRPDSDARHTRHDIGGFAKFFPVDLDQLVASPGSIGMIHRNMVSCGNQKGRRDGDLVIAYYCRGRPVGPCRGAAGRGCVRGRQSVRKRRATRSCIGYQIRCARCVGTGPSSAKSSAASAAETQRATRSGPPAQGSAARAAGSEGNPAPAARSQDNHAATASANGNAAPTACSQDDYAPAASANGNPAPATGPEDNHAPTARSEDDHAPAAASENRRRWWHATASQDRRGWRYATAAEDGHRLADAAAAKDWHRFPHAKAAKDRHRRAYAWPEAAGRRGPRASGRGHPRSARRFPARRLCSPGRLRRLGRHHHRLALL